jgi:RHS repeat-associated protein
MTKVPKPDNWSSTFNLVYDAWNRLVTVKDSNNSTKIADYAYDGLNRRVVKKTYASGTLSETRTFYYNKDWQCLEEYVGSTCKVRYIWGLRYIDDLVTYRKDSTDYYAVQDANWNVVALTNTSGVVQERYTYSSFGKLNVFDVSFTPKTVSTCNLTRSFTGQVLDNETGLMLYRNRVYHPTLGRFLQRDPIGYFVLTNIIRDDEDVYDIQILEDINLFMYVKNSSINQFDILGFGGNQAKGGGNSPKCEWLEGKTREELKKMLNDPEYSKEAKNDIRARIKTEGRNPEHNTVDGKKNPRIKRSGRARILEEIIKDISKCLEKGGSKCVRCFTFIGAFCEAMTPTQLGDAEIKRPYPNNQHNLPDYGPVIPVPSEPSDTPDLFPNIFDGNHVYRPPISVR